MAEARKIFAEQPSFDPAKVEEGMYQRWEENGYFKPLSDRDPKAAEGKPSYSITMPPPNVTGALHLGHQLTNSVQDTLIRWKRMQGYNTLYLPGLDHAGIATQVVVEKMLKAKEGKSRHDYGREEFIKRVWEWREQYGNRICVQSRRTGCSADWSRLSFSLDPEKAKAAVHAFVTLSDKGLLKRDTRLVHWSCALKSAISDVEVDYEDVKPGTFFKVPGYDKGVELGYMFHFYYQVEDSDEKLEIATTRAETIVGDTAIAIHPEDKRYTHLHGKRVKCPFRDEYIPIVQDATLVDMEFGTGVVKITPAHDPNDYESGKRHNLPQIVVFTDDGIMNNNAGEFAGQKRFLCREAIQKRLAEMGLAHAEKPRQPHTYRVGLCSRSKDIVEPAVKPQWFLDLSKQAEQAVKAAQDGDLKLVPKMHNQTWERWLTGLRPWCLSRQLWWGQQIPAYYATLDKPRGPEDPEDNAMWVVGHSEEEARARAVELLGITKEEEARVVLTQDCDVLDTWFSASLHPFYTMGWPDKTPDLEKFYPNSLMETGHDILFFWVARMVMMGLALTEKLPFKEVFLHAMVRDKNGEKMSKSKGNVIDPIDVMDGITQQAMIEKLEAIGLSDKELDKAKKATKENYPKGIETCGSDALRLGLLAYTASGRSVNLDIERVVGYRKFANKLWNATKFSFNLLPEDYTPPASISPEEAAAMPLCCRWMLSRCDAAATEVTGCLERFELAGAAQHVHELWLHQFCDIFIELSKRYTREGADPAEKKCVQDTMWYTMDVGLRLLHPMMPFVTEKLYSALPKPAGVKVESIMLEAWPTPAGFRSEAAEADMENVMGTVHKLRSLKASMCMPDKVKPKAFISAADAKLQSILTAESENIQLLGQVGEVTVSADSPPKDHLSQVVNGDITAGVEMKDIDIGKELKKYEKKRLTLQKNLEKMEKQMNDTVRYAKIPDAVKEKNTIQHESNKKELAATIKIEEALSELTK